MTGVSRTLFDLAAVLTGQQLEQAMNQAEVLGLTDRVSIPDLLNRYPGRRGSAALRALFREESASRGVTRSELEERFLSLIDANDLPRPRLNANLELRGRFIEIDCLWRRERMIVELDGRATHGTSWAFEGDRERDRALLVEGWRTMRVTWRQLRDEPSAVVADLCRLLENRRPVAW